jgi:hypothetical protein
VWVIGAPDANNAAAPTGTGITALGTTPTATDYCLVAQNGNYYAWKHGPGGTIKVDTVVANVCT